jgi:hypothetical protein
VAVVETEYRNNVLTGDMATARQILDQARRRDAATKAVEREMSVTQQNQVIENLNERICSTLLATTGQYFVSSTPESWWKWWNDYNEVYDLSTKPVNMVYYKETVAFADPYSGQPGSSGGSGGGGSGPGYGRTYECLVAGTLVWTDTGPVRIEQIKVGDRVLSQDPQTGEVAYKPVLRTTTRPPAFLMKLQVGDESVQCSGGHPFWVSGEGWTKARLLKPDSPVHTLTGTQPVRSVEETGFETTYNLIVADFHTYFVGKAKILSHDNTIRKATGTIVPGLRN